MNEGVKYFEVRDAMTFIPVIAVLIDPSKEENWLTRRAGFRDKDYVLLTNLQNMKTQYDIYTWDNRTMRVAHDHILRSWHKLKDGELIDVEFILGETSSPKESERR